MRIPLILLAVLATTPSAFALQGSDTMRAWKKASRPARAELLDRLLGKRPPGDVARASVVRCVDQASDVAGHSDLSIAEIAKACASESDAGQPV